MDEQMVFSGMVLDVQIIDTLNCQNLIIDFLKKTDLTKTF
jgi:hypothetical protein